MAPSIRAEGTKSCIRLMARRNVDLPQPLGPIIAVTALPGISTETRLRTWLEPKKTDKSWTRMAGSVVPGAAVPRSGGVTGCAGTGGSGNFRFARSIVIIVAHYLSGARQIGPGSTPER